MTDIIAIHGLKGSGKSTVASMINHYRPQMTQWAFAQKLKALCAVAFDLPISTFHNEALKEKKIHRLGRTPRSLMTSLSDAMKSTYGADFFAKDLEGAYLEHSKGGLIVTDLRAYAGEERQAVDHLGGKVLHIIRPVNEMYAMDKHSSEGSLPILHGDYVIFNTGNLAELNILVRKAVVQMYGPNALNAYPYVSQSPDDPLHLTNSKM